MIGDALACAWVVAATAAIALLVARAIPWRHGLLPSLRLARATCGAALLAALVAALAAAGMLSWTSLLLVLLVWPVGRRLARRSGLSSGPRNSSVHRWSLVALDVADGWLPESLRDAPASAWAAGRRAGTDAVRRWLAPSGILLAGAIAAIAAALAGLRWRHPLGELRLGHPDLYSTLLETRQLVAGDDTGLPSALGALVAGLTLLSGADAMQVLRFLGPLLGTLAVVAVAEVTWTLSRSAAAALGAAFALVVTPAATLAHAALRPDSPPTWASASATLDEASLRQWTGGSVELGVLALLAAASVLARAVTPSLGRVAMRLAVGSDAEREPPATALLALALCLGLVAWTAPVLLLLVPIAWAALRLHAATALATLAAAWCALAAAGLAAPELPGARTLALSSPAAVALLAGAALTVVGGALAKALGRVRVSALEAHGAVLVVAAVAVLALGRPRGIAGAWIEHDAAARQAVRIVREMPRRQWLVAAPVEQLAEVYGFGYFQDLAALVKEQAMHAGDPSRRLGPDVRDVFVFVEKKPFRFVPLDPATLTWEILADPTWRDYRSPAGRSGLQHGAWAICETYFRAHPGSEIWHDDDVLRVYRFPGGRR